MQHLSQQAFNRLCNSLPDQCRRLMLFIGHRWVTGYRESFIEWSTGWTDVAQGVRQLHAMGLLLRTEKGRVKVRYRVPRELIVPRAVPAGVKLKVKKRDRNRCVYCRAPFRRTRPTAIDHRVPISRGGTNDVANLALACTGSRSCNTRKSAHTDIEFITPKVQWPPE